MRKSEPYTASSAAHGRARQLKRETESSQYGTVKMDAEAEAMVDGRLVLEQMAAELAELHLGSTRLQALISELAGGENCDVARMKRLQEIDYSTQVLENLARVAALLANGRGQYLDRCEIQKQVTLVDLRDRLIGSPQEDRPTHPSSTDEDEVSWL